MSGKRTWFVIRKHLLQAAENKIAKGAPLADMLYIPEVFSAERKAGLMQRHLSAVSKIASGAAGPRRLMLLIGEVKEFVASRSGQKLVVKHLPDFPFVLSEDLRRRITARFERELTLWNAVTGAHLMVIATFGVGPTGVAVVEELALMVVTETWIPIEHIYDANLINALTEHRRRFVKRSATISPPRDRLQRRSSPTPSPPPSRCMSSRREQTRRAGARSNPLLRRAPCPLGFGRQARIQCRRFPERELVRDTHRYCIARELRRGITA